MIIALARLIWFGEVPGTVFPHLPGAFFYEPNLHT